MARPKPYAVASSSRTTIPASVNKQGVKTFGSTGYYSEFFNSNVYSQSQEWVLGLAADVTNEIANIYYDDASGLFKDLSGATVTLLDFDRVSIITVTADQNIDMPSGTSIEFVPYDEVDLDSNTMNLPGTYTGELRVNNGTVVLSGTSHGLRINGTATVTTTSMTGTCIVNGSLKSNDIRINEDVAVTSTSTEINQLDGFNLSQATSAGHCTVSSAGTLSNEYGIITSSSNLSTGKFKVDVSSSISFQNKCVIVNPQVNSLDGATDLTAHVRYGGTGDFQVWVYDAGVLIDRGFSVLIFLL